MDKYDVFISSKSEDYKLASDVYEFLCENGIKAFFADKELQELGNADYSDCIDSAIDGVKHMIVVGSSCENIESKWVKTEWRAFTDEQRSGRKNGNIMTILHGVSPQKLPLTLRNVQSFTFEEYPRKILKYVKDENHDEVKKNKVSDASALSLFARLSLCKRIILSILLAIIVVILYGWLSVSEITVKSVWNKQNEIQFYKKNKTQAKEIESKIFYYAGQMDSVYTVACHLYVYLNDYKVPDLQEMEFGTIEYTDFNKTKYNICIYDELTEMDSVLMEFMECRKLYASDFEVIDSLSSLLDEYTKRSFTPKYEISFADSFCTRFTIIYNNQKRFAFLILFFIVVGCFTFYILSNTKLLRKYLIK